MWRARRQSSLIGALCLGLLWALGASAAELTAPAPRKLALLVGIGKYQSPDFDPLPGAWNDLTDVKQTLELHGFKSADTRVLWNEQAAHTGIVEAFQQHLIAQATSETTVFFYFVGHGSQMKSADPGEADAMDETLCPYDTRADGIYDLRDKELAGLIELLCAKTRRVTVMFDCCHSHNVTRQIEGVLAEGFSVRRAPPDLRPPPPASSRLLPPPPAPDYAFRGSRALRAPANSRRPSTRPYTAFYACLSHQSALGKKIDGVPRGLFTYYFCRALRGRHSRTTLRDLLEQVQAEVRAAAGVQMPTAEGNLDALPFSGVTVRQAPLFLIETIDGRPGLNAGKPQGITVKSVFDLYPPETRTFTGAPLATAVVEEVTAFRAELSLLGPAQDIPPRAHAVERRHSFQHDPFRISVQLEGHPLQPSVLQAISRCKGVAVTVSAGEAAFIIAPAADQGLQFVDSTATFRLANLPPRASLDEIELEIRKWSVWLATLHVAHPGSMIQSELRVELVKSRALEGRGLPPAEQTFHAGDQVQIHATNLYTEPLFITVLNFSSNGEISQIYPPEHGFQQILPNQPWKSEIFETEVPAGESRGREIIKLFLTRKAVDFSPLLTRRSRSPRDVVPTVAQAFESDADDWGVAQRVFDVICVPAPAR